MFAVRVRMQMLVHGGGLCSNQIDSFASSGGLLLLYTTRIKLLVLLISFRDISSKLYLMNSSAS